MTQSLCMDQTDKPIKTILLLLRVEVVQIALNGYFLGFYKFAYFSPKIFREFVSLQFESLVI